MNECAQARKRLAGEFKKYQKVFIALGDETGSRFFLFY